jgi:acyl-CoA reductase-like NAD-dependent aldehyde dehydrogenase
VLTKAPRVGNTVLAGNAGERTIFDPFDGSIVGKLRYADAAEMLEAIKVAEKTFQTTRKQSYQTRSSVLLQASALITARRDELAMMITRECGKPIRQSRVEVDRAAFTFRAASHAALDPAEIEMLEMPEKLQGTGRTGFYRYFPLGVIAGVTPFNFPLNLVAHKVAPAIAAGNTIILKPAPQTPFTSFLLTEILQEAGLVAGALSIVPCENDVAELLVRDERVKMLSFTGSALVGWKLKPLATKAKVTLELGGNGAVIVDGVKDLDALIPTLTASAFNYAGQVCIGLQNLFVKRKYFDAVLAQMIAFSKQIVVGDPKDEKTSVGSMISSQAAERIETWIAEAIALGGVRHTGEFRAPNWVTPTILTNVSHDSKLFAEEAFAPTLNIEAFDDIEDAFRVVNGSKYGLQVGLYTSDSAVIERAFEMLELGALIVNDSNSFRIDTMPYGGVKDSGVGREGVRFAMREMSELKLLVTKA